jgi:hypothetical protein
MTSLRGAVFKENPRLARNYEQAETDAERGNIGHRHHGRIIPQPYRPSRLRDAHRKPTISCAELRYRFCAATASSHSGALTNSATGMSRA